MYLSTKILTNVTKEHCNYSFNKICLSQDLDAMLCLWYHECCRVFQDRLVNDEDKSWFDNLLRSKIQEHYQMEAKQALGIKPILFADFLDTSSGQGFYEQVEDFEKLSKALYNNLNEYNSESTKPMKLVLFLDAISHVCRITRIIRQPMGNALLLGMGGSGKYYSLHIMIGRRNCKGNLRQCSIVVR